MQMLAYVFRLRPTRAQHVSLVRILRDQRILYNAALQERRDAWAKKRLSIGMNDQTRSLTLIRSFEPSYGDLPYNISKWTLKRVDDAMTAFFARVKKGKAGFPRFRNATRWDSFGFHQKGGLRLINGRLSFSSGLIGRIRLRMHRPLPQEAIIKSAVFTKIGRHWRVGLTIAVATLNAHAHPDAECGVDVGVETLATLSDGTRFENIRPRAKRARELRRASRALARCRRGSKRRLKVKARLAAAQKRVRDQRSARLHAVSAAIAKRHALVCVENLQLRNMTRSARGTLAEPGTNVRQKAGLNRALADAAPGRLISMLRYKAERAGGVCIEVDPCGTSQMCSGCSTMIAKTLSIRRHVCTCGIDLHRDHNAALNILSRGLTARGAGKRPGEPNVADSGVRALGTTAAKAA